MFTQITWEVYATTVTVLAVCYLLFLQLKSSISMKRNVASRNNDIVYNRNQRGHNDEEVSHDTHLIQTFKKQNLFPVAQLLCNEIQEFLEGSIKDRINKSALLHTIKMLVHKYPDLKGSSFEQFINNLIKMGAEEYCSIQVSAEEIKLLW